MKPSAFFFCVLALLTLAEAQILCTFDDAVRYIVQGGPSDSSATSNQPPASSNASSGSSNASSGGSGGSSSSSNESSGDVNIPSAADDSSSLDPLSVGLTASLENSAASTKLLVDSVKARALQFARRLTKRADFTCTEEETCYTVNNGLFCANGRNGNFHEPDGTVGNINTGDYTLADGRQGNLYNGPRPEQSNGSTATAAVSRSAGSPTLTSSAMEAAGGSTLASASELTAATAITAQDEPPTSQATGTESRRSTTASPTSNTRTTGSSASSTLQPESSVSGAAASSTAAPGNAASNLHLPNRTVAAVMSIIIGCLLWRTSFF